MEEATELFAIQREQVRVLLARTNALVAAAAATPAPIRVPRPQAPVAPGPPAAVERMEPSAEGLLFLAVGAGLLAAMVKRVQAPPPSPPPKKSVTPSSTRRP